VTVRSPTLNVSTECPDRIDGPAIPAAGRRAAELSQSAPSRSIVAESAEGCERSNQANGLRIYAQCPHYSHSLSLDSRLRWPCLCRLTGAQASPEARAVVRALAASEPIRAIANSAILTCSICHCDSGQPGLFRTSANGAGNMGPTWSLATDTSHPAPVFLKTTSKRSAHAGR
jgi:hypothetical protein